MPGTTDPHDDEILHTDAIARRKTSTPYALSATIEDYRGMRGQIASESRYIAELSRKGVEDIELILRDSLKFNGAVTCFVEFEYR